MLCLRISRTLAALTYLPTIPMKELTARLQALGLSEEMTTKVIATVAEFVKSRVPSSFHGMIDDVLAGKSPDFGNLGGLLGGLKGFFK